MASYRVLHIACTENASLSSLEETYRSKIINDTKEFPQLCKLVNDESELFIYCEDTYMVFKASEFFHMTDISKFSTE